MYWLNQINKYITTLMFKLQSKLLRKSRVAFKLVFDILHNIRNGGFNYFHIVSTRNSKWNDFTIARILWRTLEKSIWRILNFVEALQRKSETTKFIIALTAKDHSRFVSGIFLWYCIWKPSKKDIKNALFCLKFLYLPYFSW